MKEMRSQTNTKISGGRWGGSTEWFILVRWARSSRKIGMTRNEEEYQWKGRTEGYLNVRNL